MRTATRAVLAASILLAAPLAATPAAAAPRGPVVLTCELHYSSYGIGYARASGDCAATGWGMIAAPVRLEFASEALSDRCPLHEYTLWGQVSGAFDAQIGWTRWGATALVTTHSGFTSTGTAAFAVTDPLGNPCGPSPVTVTAVFALAGI